MRSLRSLALGTVGVALFGGVALASGCINQENERTLELAIGTRCTLNSDCTDPNVCVFGVCHAQCNTSADCEHGERCVKGDASGGSVCQLTVESTCATTTDCVGDQICGVDGKCRDGCKADGDCLTGQLCAQGTCADTSEVDTTTGKLPEDPEHVGEGQPCVYNTDCPDQLTCVENTCAFECNGTKDCAPGLTCEEHRCKLPTTTTLDCVKNTDCGAGFLCTSNECVAGCVTDAGCAVGARCLGGQCANPLFDAAGTADAVTVAGDSLFTVYNGKVLKCPLTGCNPSNVVELYQAPLPFSNNAGLSAPLSPWKSPSGATSTHAHRGTQPSGGLVPKAPGNYAPQSFEDQTYDLFSDGGLTMTVVPADFSNDFLGGCVDAACSKTIQVTSYPNSVAAAMRASGNQAVFYRAGYPEGLELSRCTLEPATGGCNGDFFFYPSEPFDGYLTSLAVQKGLTPDEDTVLIGYSNGLIESYSVAACLSQNCTPTTLANVVDGIGQPIEIGNLRVDGADLYWLTAESSGNGLTYRIQTCTIAACAPKTVYTGTSFYTPQMGVADGKLVISDDSNIWLIPLP